MELPPEQSGRTSPRTSSAPSADLVRMPLRKHKFKKWYKQLNITTALCRRKGGCFCIQTENLWLRFNINRIFWQDRKDRYQAYFSICLRNCCDDSLNGKRYQALLQAPKFCPSSLGDLQGKVISHNMSPMAVLAKYIKETSPNAKVIFICPCTAKKAEVQLEEVRPYIDTVLTFE